MILNSAKQFFIFSFIGILNTLIHYSVFLFLLRVLDVNYLISSGIGYCCGLINSYFLNRKFTFKVTQKKSAEEASKFVVVNIVALLTNLGMMKLLVETLGIIPEISQIMAITGSVMVNFLGNKLWTFKPLRMGV